MISAGGGSPGAHLHQGRGAGDEIKKNLPSGHKIYTEVTPWAQVVSPIQVPIAASAPSFCGFIPGEQGTALVKSLIEEMGAFVTAPTAGQPQHPNTASVKIENHLNINEEGDKMDNYH